MGISMREHMTRLEAAGKLLKIKKPVDLKHELAAYIRKSSDTDGPALLFENVIGSDMPVLGGIFATQKLLEFALGASGKERLEKYQQAIDHPIEPKVVSQAPCQEIVLTGNDVDLSKLPIAIYNEKDSDPYITMGVVISKDLETGIGNAAIHRMQVKNKNTLGCQLGPYAHLGIQTKNAQKLGKKMEIAVAIGVSPQVILASQARVPFGFDELTVAGGLAGKPLEVVPCRTVDILVPADAELIIEGEFDPNVMEPEGIFAEYPGYYGPVPLTPVINVKAITYRKNPIFLSGLTGKPVTENHLLRSLPMETELYFYTKQVSENIKDVHMTPGGATFMAAISLEQTRPFEARQVLMSALGSRARCKFVVAVDEDIDIKDTEEVLWAINTRSQADRDVIIVPRVPVCELDPSGKDGGTAAMAIDATMPFDEDFEEPARVPGVEKIKCF